MDWFIFNRMKFRLDDTLYWRDFFSVLIQMRFWFELYLSLQRTSCKVHWAIKSLALVVENHKIVRMTGMEIDP